MAAEPPGIAVICGPTGAGKTSAAISLARDCPLEVVSADSRQIIKHLNIGTAKPTPEEQAAVRFHLIDLIEPGERYSAYRFIDDATRATHDVLERGRIPLIVGGTGLYLRALSEGVIEIEEDDPGIRNRLQADLDKYGAEAMFNRLKEVDPDEAAKTHPNNTVRVLRALEIFCLTGKTKSQLQASGTYKRSNFEFSFYCLAPPRQMLYDRINRRVDTMIEHGLLQEIEELVSRGKAEQIRRAGVIGYTEMLDHIEGVYTLDEAISLTKQNHRRYAKRQMTWFRRQLPVTMFSDIELLLKAMKSEITF